MEYRLSPPAQRDFESIWDYIAQDDPEAAAAFTLALRAKVETIADQPKIGRRCDDLLPGLRKFPARNYLIFYRIHSDHIEILRVLHGARDIESIFHPEEPP